MFLCSVRNKGMESEVEMFFAFFESKTLLISSSFTEERNLFSCQFRAKVEVEGFPNI